MNPLEKNITVLVNQGVHGRIASGLAHIARHHDVQIHILDKEGEIDCSSVLEVLSMGFVSGKVVKFRVHGDNALQAIHEVEQLLAAREE